MRLMQYKEDNWLGDYFRGMKAKGVNKHAMVATANKMATIYYIRQRLLTLKGN